MEDLGQQGGKNLPLIRMSLGTKNWRVGIFWEVIGSNTDYDFNFGCSDCRNMQL